MIETKLKSHKWWLVWRVFLFAYLIAWPLSLPIIHFGGSQFDWYIFALLPFLPLELYLFFDVAVFPLAYSLCGPLKRSPLPQEKPVAIIGPTFNTTIGGLGKAISVKWLIYNSGLGISVSPFGSVFIPNEQIQGFREQEPFSEPTTQAFYRTMTILETTSPEVQKPIVVPPAVAKQIEKEWKVPGVCQCA